MIAGAAGQVASPATRPGRLDPAYDVLRFLTLLNHTPGYVESFAGAPRPSDPAKIDKAPGTQRFTYHRPDADHTAHAIVEQVRRYWADRLVDSYISVLSYKTKDRDVTKAQPSNIVFLDDPQRLPGGLEPSFKLETSPGNYQYFYRVDRALTLTQYDNLTRRGTAAAGADPSGVDLTQVCRIPGTLNTKRGGRWRVKLIEGPSKPYSIDQLHAAWPEVAHTPPPGLCPRATIQCAIS